MIDKEQIFTSKPEHFPKTDPKIHMANGAVKVRVAFSARFHRQFIRK